MITATVITLNEEEKIGNALKSLQRLADEIIMVDSGSVDKTIEIAKKFGAKVFFRKFDNFASQKNWAASKARRNWILSLDADEEIPKELAEEIRNAVKTNQYEGFLIGRRNFILGKEIKYSRWSPDNHIWLWKKNKGKWVGDVHEEVLIEGRVGRLKNKKIHLSHRSVGEFIKSNDLYSSLEAQSLHSEGVKFSFWKTIWFAKFEFLLRFIYKLGFLDGLRGFILCYLMAIYKLTVWIKLWELQKK